MAEASHETAPRPSFWMRAIFAVTGPWTWGNLSGILKLIAVIFFLKSCVLDQYAIPSGSMEPTLHGDPRFLRGDRVLVNKWVFGPRIPLTTIRLATWGGPERWDIIVFKPVEGTSEHSTLIKRVIGLPGETVHIEEGKIHINGEIAEPPEDLRDILHYTTAFGPPPLEVKKLFLELAKQNQPLGILNPANETVQRLYADMNIVNPRVSALDIETLPEEEIAALTADVSRISLDIVIKMFTINQAPLEYGIRPEPEFSQVPEGHYLMMGDNSAQSLDGRVYGWVPHNHLLGQAFAVWWPWARRRDFSGFSQTWWGMGLLYGIPLAIVGIEAYAFRRDRQRRRLEGAEAVDPADA